MLRTEGLTMKIATIILLAGLLAGCNGMYDDNLSVVPVTNNPNIMPQSHTAQGPGF